MQLKEHLLYGGAATVILAPFLGAKVLLFFFSTILIDADHYIDFLYYGKFRNWSVKSMFAFHGQMGRSRHLANFCALEAFHTIEFLLALLALAYYFSSPELYILLSGMIFHLYLDLYRLYKMKGIHLRALSFTEYWIRARRMKRAGTHIEKLFEEAYAISMQRTQTH